MSSQGGTTSDIDSRILYIKLSGLPWTSSYNTTNPTSDVIMNVVKIPTTINESFITNFGNPQVATFTKNTDYVNITIQLHALEGDDFYLFTDAGELLGQMNFLFNIYGVENDNIDITRNRLQIK
jgi:hypothetical protein